MKKRPYILTSILTALLIGLTTSVSQAQFDQIEDFLRAGEEDAETITRAYMKPIPSGIGADLNSGWFNKAGTHSTLGFSIQIRGAAAFIPGNDQSFDLNDLDLNKVRAADPANTVSPTIGGSEIDGPEVVVEDQGEEVARFNLPPGAGELGGMNIVPAPMVQASLGLVKDTDLIVRFIPKINVQEYGDFNMTGFGLKHKLNQWLPGGNVLPVDISLMAAFSKINISANLNLERQDGNLPDPDYSGNYDNQKIKTTFNTFNARAVVGKTIPFISVYGGVGFETSSMELDVVGDYPVPVSNPIGPDFTETLTDPFSYSDDGGNSFSLLAGANLKLAFFNIFAEYTLADYSVLNAGVGFSFR